MRVLLPVFMLTIFAAASPAAAKMIHIEIKNVAYSPAKISAHIGDAVEWENKDFVAHTATARDKQWNIVLPPHAKGSVVMKKAGHIVYYCTYHPNMQGEIDVTP